MTCLSVSGPQMAVHCVHTHTRVLPWPAPFHVRFQDLPTQCVQCIFARTKLIPQPRPWRELHLKGLSGKTRFEKTVGDGVIGMERWQAHVWPRSPVVHQLARGAVSAPERHRNAATLMTRPELGVSGATSTPPSLPRDGFSFKTDFSWTALPVPTAR